MDPATIAAILGHADKAFTMRTYTHEINSVKVEAMEKLGQALFGDRNGKFSLMVNIYFPESISHNTH